MNRKFIQAQNHFFNHFFWYLLGLTLVIATALYFLWHKIPSADKTSVLLGVTVLLAGIYYNIVSFKIARDQLFKDLFTEFNTRYDGLNSDLNAIINDEKPRRAKDDVLLDYLNLCAEEYLWYKKGRIDPEVWASWSAGITFFLTNEYIKPTVDRERNLKASYYGIFDGDDF